jgi:formylglycine-generating enzyme required for sulfatase activity
LPSFAYIAGFHGVDSNGTRIAIVDRVRSYLLSLALLFAATACADDVATSIDSSTGSANPTGRGDESVTNADPTSPGDPAASVARGENASSAPSCAREHGGRTCGPNGNEDCCSVATQGQYKVDKYMITAGRMRAFVEHVKGDVKGFVESLGPDKWKPEWSEKDSLSFDMDSANEILGPYANKKACNQGAHTGHTYWTPKTGDDYSDFDQDTLDDKALNCVPWGMLQALCAFDGGHLATLAELRAAFTNNGTTTYPWGNDPVANVSAPDPQQRLNLEGGFQTSPLPPAFRKDSDGDPAEVSFHIAPPGRFPKGNNKAGVADAAGNLLEWVGDKRRQFVWKGDFEHHASNAAALNFGKWWWEKPFPIGEPWVWGTSQLLGNAGTDDQRNGYYTIGGRCGH